MRNALTNVVGASQRTDVHVVEETLSGGELLLLSTDGVHGVLDDDRIEQLMRDVEATRRRPRRAWWPPRLRAAAATTARPSSRGISAD